MEGLGYRPGGALITVPDNFLSLQRDLIISLAAKYTIPAIYPYRYFGRGWRPAFLWNGRREKLRARDGLR